MNRHERRALASGLRRGAFDRPEHLEMVAPERWPAVRQPREHSRRIAVWVSRKYLAQIFQEPPVSIGGETFELHRITINRATLEANGRPISWEELQAIKSSVGFESHYAIEVFPAAMDVVNVANMRHLWVVNRPLPIGWTRY